MIDIKAQDDAEIADQARKNWWAIDLSQYWTKLSRFINAFHKMYDWTKVFKEISNESWEKKIFFNDKQWNIVDINNFSTGEKQILFRVWDMLKNLWNHGWWIIFIDEPETSLHPRRQKKYLTFLLDIFSWIDVQIIIATHSPYLLQWLEVWESKCIKLNKDEAILSQDIWYYPCTLWNPSLNLINYLAYWICNELFHIELFTAIQIKNKIQSIDKMNNYFKKINSIEFRSFCTSILNNHKTNQQIWTLITETLPVYIRNKIHHWDETNRKYTEQDLENSIKLMLRLLWPV